jgi:uncharacterized protein YpuA (DUF1002 family)
VKTPVEGLQRQFDLSKQVYSAMVALGDRSGEDVDKLRDSMRTVLSILQSADVTPSAQIEAAVKEIVAQVK